MKNCKVILERTLKDSPDIPAGKFLKWEFHIHDTDSFADFFEFVLCSIRDGEQFGTISFSVE